MKRKESGREKGGRGREAVTKVERSSEGGMQSREWGLRGWLGRRPAEQQTLGQFNKVILQRDLEGIDYDLPDWFDSQRLNTMDMTHMTRTPDSDGQ